MEILDQGMSLHPPRKRRFPGPAGLLPDLDEERIMNLNALNYPSSQLVSQIISEDSRNYESIRRRKGRVEMTHLATQVEKNQQLLTGYPWKELNRYLNECPEISKVMNEYSIPSSPKNIDWVLNYVRKLTACVRIPFLTVVLQDTPLVPRNRLAEKRTQCVQVIDPSGTVEVALDAEFVKLYSAHLVPGTALALKKAGLFRCRTKPRVILTITKENVIYLASAVQINDDNSERKATTSNDSESDITLNNIICKRNDVTIFKVCEKDFSYDDIVQDYRKLTDPKLYAAEVEELKRESQFYDLNSSSTSLANGPNARRSNSYSYTSTTMNQPQIPKTMSSSASFLQNENTSDSYPGFSFEDDEDGDELFKNIDLDSALYEAALNNTICNQSQVTNNNLLVSSENSQSTSNDNVNNSNNNNNNSGLNTSVQKEEDFEPFGDDDSFDQDMLLLDIPEEKEEERQTNTDQNLNFHSIQNNVKEEEEEEEEQQQQEPTQNEMENSFNEDKEEEEGDKEKVESSEEENLFSDEEMDFEYENEENPNQNNQTSQNNDNAPDDFFDSFDAELQMM